MQDLVDATCEPSRSEQGVASCNHNPWPEFLELLPHHNLVASESSYAPEGIRATAREDGQLRPRPERAYPYGDPLAQAALPHSRRREQASARQADESAPPTRAAVRRACGSANQASRKIADRGSYARDPTAVKALLWPPRVPRRVALAIAGVVGSILIATFGALAYYALSASTTSGSAPAINDNIVEEKTSAADPNDNGEARNEQGGGTAWSGQPKKVRTVTFRPDSGAANAPAAVESSVNARSELSAAAMLLARPSADERPERGAASPRAPAFLDSQSEPNASPASRAGRNVDEQEMPRTGPSRAQVPARNGEIACQTSAGQGGWWAWRIIDGRKCWYEGKAGMSKDNLRWVRTGQ